MTTILTLILVFVAVPLLVGDAIRKMGE